MKDDRKYACCTTKSQGKAPRVAPQRVTFALLLALLGLSGVATFVLASDVSDAGYRGRITISNNSSDATLVSAVFDLNTQSLINTNKLNSSASDCAMQVAAGTDTTFMPSVNSSYPWVTWVEAIGEDETIYQYLYTSGVTGGKIRYFPDTGGMVTPDSASLELGDNFTIEQSGWINTDSGASKYLVNKPDTFCTYVSNTENITSDIYEYGVLDGYETGSDYEREFYNTTWYAMTFTPSSDITIESVSMYSLREGSPGTVTVSIRATSAGLPTGGDLTSGTTNGNDWDTSLAWHLITLSEYEVTSGVQYAIVARMGAGSSSINIKWGCDTSSPAYPGGNMCRSTNSGSTWEEYPSPNPYDALFRVTGTSPTSSVTATGISSGEHIVITSANLTSLGIWVDGSLKDSTALSSNVTDSSENWTFLQNSTMPYMEYHKITIDGTLQQHIVWEYDTTFTDLSGNSHDATPTFRDTSSNAYVSANLTSFVGIMDTTPPPAAGQAGWSILPTVPTSPTGFFTEFNPADMTFWGSGFIAEFHTNTEIPLALIVFPYAFGLAIGFGFLAWYISSGGGKNKHGRGSLLAMAITNLIVMIYFVYGAGGVIPGWILLPFGIEVLAFIVWRQTPSPF